MDKPHHTMEAVRQQRPDWPIEQAAQAARSGQSARRSYDARRRIRHGDGSRNRLRCAAGPTGGAAAANASPPLQPAPDQPPPPQPPPLAGAMTGAPTVRLSAAVPKPARLLTGPHGSPNAAADTAEPQCAAAATFSQPAALPGIFCPALDPTPAPPSFPVCASEVLLRRIRSGSAGAGDPGRPDCSSAAPAGAPQVPSSSISAALASLGTAAAAGLSATGERSFEQILRSAAPAPAASAPAATATVSATRPSSAEDLGETILPGYFSLMRPAAAQPACESIVTHPAAAAATADLPVSGELPRSNASVQSHRSKSASQVFAEPLRRSAPLPDEFRQAAGRQAVPEPQVLPLLEPPPLPPSERARGRQARRRCTDPPCTASSSDGIESGVRSMPDRQLPRFSARGPESAPSPPSGIKSSYDTPQLTTNSGSSGSDSPPLRLSPRSTAGMNGVPLLAPEAGSPAVQRQLSSKPAPTVAAASGQVSQTHEALEQQQVQEQLRQLDEQPPPPEEVAVEDPAARSSPGLRPSAPALISEPSQLTAAQTAVKDKVSGSAAVIACNARSDAAPVLLLLYH